MSLRRARRPLALVTALVAVAVLGACDKLDQFLTAGPADPYPLAIEVSTPSASVGERVAVAISNEGSLDLGALQGRLRFDPKRLRYRGQVRDAGDNQVLLVNAGRSESGELRFVAVDAKGLVRTGALVFDVLDDGYAPTLTLLADQAIQNGKRMAVAAANVQQGARMDVLLSRNAEASRLSADDWTAVLKERAATKSAHADDAVDSTAVDLESTGVLSPADALRVLDASIDETRPLVGTARTGALLYALTVLNDLAGRSRSSLTATP